MVQIIGVGGEPIKSENIVYKESTEGSGNLFDESKAFDIDITNDNVEVVVINMYQWLFSYVSDLDMDMGIYSYIRNLYLE